MTHTLVVSAAVTVALSSPGVATGGAFMAVAIGMLLHLAAQRHLERAGGVVLAGVRR